MEKEVFVDSPIFPQKYIVSNYGTVITKATNLKRKLGVNKDGYKYVRLHNNGVSKYMTIHRLVALAFVDNDNPKDHYVINHIDGDKTNNFYKNLEWCDVKHNTNHSYELGLQKPIKGSKHGRSKYKEEQIEDVCSMLEKGQMTIKDISEITGIPVRTIQSVRAGENWSFISKKYNFKDRRLKRTCND